MHLSVQWTSWQIRVETLHPETVADLCAETVWALWLHETVQGVAESLDQSLGVDSHTQTSLVS